MRLRRLLVAALASLPFMATAQTCLIVGVSDGDSLTARCGTAGAYAEVKVRLAGIDAPERRQAFGARSAQALSDLTLRKTALLDCVKSDRYGRQVCNVRVAPNSAPGGPPTLDLGLAMLSQGMAWWYRAYARDQSPEARGQYKFAESEARVRQAGLWRDAEQVAPWDWRRQQADARAQDRAQH